MPQYKMFLKEQQYKDIDSLIESLNERIAELEGQNNNLDEDNKDLKF